jgi:hypothetical protein
MIATVGLTDTAGMIVILTEAEIGAASLIEEETGIATMIEEEIGTVTMIAAETEAVTLIVGGIAIEITIEVVKEIVVEETAGAAHAH